MGVAELASVLGVDVAQSADFQLAGITHDSRKVQPGWLFCCVPGAEHDGHNFASAAQSSGAVALLVERHLDGLEVAQIQVPDVRKAMGPAAALIHGKPAEAMTTVGITGTNGKTTITHLLKSIFDKAGWKNEAMGTLTGARTTPEAPELQERLSEFRAKSVRVLAMEVSSHALSMDRVGGIKFDVAVFTNLSQDHLDFHDSMEEYFQAKAKLFTPQLAEVAIVNLDEPHGRRIAEDAKIDVIGYSLSDADDLNIDGPISHFKWQDQPVTLQLGGTHNVSNAIAAASVALRLGIDPVDIADGLCAADPPRGRFELVNLGQPFVVAVDYAHTPDALTAVLGAAREVAGSGRVIVVFGCGGDRDATKRPVMGAAAEAGSDLTIVTNDNPRSEDPDTILQAIVSGLTRPDDAIVCADRALAIGQALGAASPGDVVIIAGKGHETTQTIGSEVSDFDDRDVVIKWIGANL